MSWVVPVIQAAASLWSAKKQNDSQKKATQAQENLAKQQQTSAAALAPIGRGFLQQSAAAYSPVLDYYKRTATGDRNTLLQTMQPELANIAGAYDRPLSTLTQTTPRALTSAQRLSLLSQRADALNRATMGARQAGIAGLAGIASDLGGKGIGTLGAEFGGLQGASQSNLGLMSQLYGIRNQNAQDSSAIGASLADALRGYQMWAAQRNTNTNTTAAPPPSSSGGLTSTPYGPNAGSYVRP